MISRIALVAGSAAAAITLAVALAVAGFAPRSTGAADAANSGVIDAVAMPAAVPTVLVDTVYLAPAIEPQTITVTDENGGEAEHDGDHDSDHGGEHDRDHGGDDD